MNDIGFAAPTQPVAAKVRYVNAEWKGKEEIPRIGSRETRRANTSMQDIRVQNARPGLASGEITLERSGFTLTENITACTNFRDEEEVKRIYYPEIEKIVKRVAHADGVFIRSHLIRTETPIDFNDGYARFVHCDYNMKRLKEMSEDVLASYGVEPKPTWEYVWFNTWQPFDNPAINNPLAFIDWQTLPFDDVIDYYYTGRNTDSLVAAPVYNPGHRWCYVPNMTTSEILVFKQMDGRRDGRSVYCPHTSFDIPETPEDAPPRRSIEVRLLAVFEKA
ncbi:MAG TPA: CmcJ/NvfI family oxidoreductase [Alphaproteobacteria bacterium]|nr:CmcJ/NvfI family oxidoreductase [Alphaproteobacteria bacterium]